MRPGHTRSRRELSDFHVASVRFKQTPRQRSRSERLMMFQCFTCGFQTRDAGDFIGGQSNGRHAWMMFICPQCSSANPKVAEVGWEDDAPWPHPTWWMEITNHGVYVVYEREGAQCSAPIHPKHQHYAQVEATHREAAAIGRTRSKAFHAEIEMFKTTRGRNPDRAEMDDMRQRHLIGPYDPRSRLEIPA